MFQTVFNPFTKKFDYVTEEYLEHNIVQLQHIIDTPEDLAKEKIKEITLLEVYKTGTSHSHYHGTTINNANGGCANTNLTDNDQPACKDELNSWLIENGTVINRQNANTYLYIDTQQKYSRYGLEVTLSIENDYGSYGGAQDSDNDMISVVIASMTDAQGMEHTLSVVFSHMLSARTDANKNVFNFKSGISYVFSNYAIVYDYKRSTERIIKNGHYLTDRPPLDRWWQGTFASKKRVQVKRTGEQGQNIAVKISKDWTSSVIDDTTLLSFNLNDFEQTKKFLGTCSFGFGQFSQKNATFTDIVLLEYDKTIYDIKNFDVWEKNISTETWEIQANRTHQELQKNTIYKNPTTNKFFFMDLDGRIYFLIDGNFSDGSNTELLGNKILALENQVLALENQAVSLLPKSPRIYIPAISCTIPNENGATYGQQTEDNGLILSYLSFVKTTNQSVQFDFNVIDEHQLVIFFKFKATEVTSPILAVFSLQYILVKQNDVFSDLTWSEKQYFNLEKANNVLHISDHLTIPLETTETKVFVKITRETSNENDTFLNAIHLLDINIYIDNDYNSYD